MLKAASCACLHHLSVCALHTRNRRWRWHMHARRWVYSPVPGAQSSTRRCLPAARAARAPHSSGSWNATSPHTARLKRNPSAPNFRSRILNRSLRLLRGSYQHRHVCCSRGCLGCWGRVCAWRKTCLRCCAACSASTSSASLPTSRGARLHARAACRPGSENLVAFLVDTWCNLLQPVVASPATVIAHAVACFAIHLQCFLSVAGGV